MKRAWDEHKLVQVHAATEVTEPSAEAQEPAEFDDNFGFQNRLNFMSQLIVEHQVRSILDFGCGSGIGLAAPLHQLFPDCEIIGVDEDAATVAIAQSQYQSGRLKFQTVQDFSWREHAFDLVILSEVLEHVDGPGALLARLNRLIKPQGILAVTSPNGTGPYEWGTLLQNVLFALKIYPLLQHVKWLLRARKSAFVRKDTYAESPHINFFRRKELTALLSSNGFQIQQWQGRAFLCGFPFDQILVMRWMIALNSALARIVPLFMVSNWMIAAQKIAEMPAGSPPSLEYRPRGLAVVQRWLSLGR